MQRPFGCVAPAPIVPFPAPRRKFRSPVHAKRVATSGLFHAAMARWSGYINPYSRAVSNRWFVALALRPVSLSSEVSFASVFILQDLSAKTLFDLCFAGKGAYFGVVTPNESSNWHCRMLLCVLLMLSLAASIVQ